MEKMFTQLGIPQKFVPDFLVRDRIINLLDDAIRYKAIFISSMSGYGKTLEVLSWSKRIDKKFYLINFNSNDTCESICKKINDEFNLQCSSLDQVISTINQVEQLKEKVIILDNFEYIANNKEALDCLVNIIKETDNMHFIIISEGGLPNELKHLLFTKHLVCLKNRDLAFTEKEIKLYLEKNNCYLEKEQLDKLYQYSIGLPVYLNAFLCRYNDNNHIFNNELLDSIKKDMIGYFDYKLSLVLSKEYDRMLVKMSRFDELNEKLISKILKTSNVEEVLEKVHNSTCILQEKDINKYALADFYRQYYLLKDLTSEEEKELEEYYINMAQKFMHTCNYIKAINYYIKAKKYDIAVEEIRKSSLLDVQNIDDIEMLKVIEKIPLEYMNNSIIMSWYLYIRAVMQYNIPEINRLYTKINELLSKTEKNTKEYYEALRISTFSKILLPWNTPRKLIKPLKNFIMEQQQNLKDMPIINITENQPSLLSGCKDFSELAVHSQNLLPIFEKFTEQATFMELDGLIELVMAEYYYQQNKINEALNLVGKGITKARKNNNFRLEFSGDVLNLKILFLTSKKELLDKLMNNLKNKLKSEKDRMFLKNLNAEEIRFDLKSGKIDRAIIWMNEEAPDIIEKFNILEKYRYTIKARVYIAIGEYTGALILLKRLEEYFVENKRWFSIIENYILQAICFEMNGSDEISIEYIEKALLLAQKYEYIRVFADEGSVMHEILIKFKSKCKNHEINQVFLNEVISETKQFADNHPFLYTQDFKKNEIQSDSNTNNLNSKKVDRLSISEKNVLDLICNGLKNAEIAKEMHISISTVKTHINHMFSKLGVKNRVQAINEARKRGVI